MKHTSSESSLGEKRIAREVSLSVFLCLALILCMVLLAEFVSLVAQNLYVLVFAIFIGVPWWVLSRKNEDFRVFGLTTAPLGRGVIWAFVCTLITLFFFVPGYIVWETKLHQRSFEYSMHHYQKWPVEMEGRPDYKRHDSAGIWVWSQSNDVYLAIRPSDSIDEAVSIRADQPFLVQRFGAGSARQLADNEWHIAPLSSDAVSEFVLRATENSSYPTEIHIESQSTHSDTPLYLGALSSPAQNQSTTVKRGYLWILLWSLTHLFFVALPEEYFYRGYVQSRLSQYFSARNSRLGKATTKPKIWLPSASNLATSALFAFGHVIIPIGGALAISRLSVFFPSLVFGWLRERTDSIVAPVIYHAACNMMVLLIVPHFFD